MKTTLKFTLRAPRSISGCSTLMLQITRHRVTRTRSTSYVLSPAEWDEKRQEIRISENAFPERKKTLAGFERSLKKDILLIHKTIEAMEEQGDYSSQDIINLFVEQQEGQLFCEYVNRRAEKLQASNRFGTAHACRYAGISFLHYLQNKDVRIEKVNATLMKSYEGYLESNGKSKNTISCYMRSLRAAYNQALGESKLFSAKKAKENPFSGVFTGNAKTQKRAIGETSISLLAEIDFSKKDAETKAKEEICHDGSVKYALDLFMFSFFTQGMSFSDMAYLKKENIGDRLIRYNRKKTGQPVSIELEDCMKRILDRYADTTSEYIFPILRGINAEYAKWEAINSALAKYNRSLKKLGKQAGISAHLTSYVARHSWASMASQEGIPIGTISRGMGHESEKTTQIYISQLDRSDVGRANRQIIAKIEKFA